MENIERIVIPITIGAAVIGIWAAFRSGGSAAPVVVQSSPAPLQIPEVAPADEVLIDPSGYSGSNAGASPSRGYTNRGYKNPLQQAPIGPSGTYDGTGQQGTPAYSSGFDDGMLPMAYVSQQPPWKNGQLAAIARAAGFTPQSTAVPTGSGCGCGGGDSCASKNGGKCPVSRNCASLMDGGGAGFLPLYQQPAAAPASWANGLVYSVETQIVPSPASMGVGHDHSVGF